MSFKEFIVFSLIIYLITCDACFFEKKSIDLEVNVSKTLTFLCGDEIRNIKFDSTFDGSVRIVGKKEIALSISRALIRTTYKYFINYLYEGILEISCAEEDDLPRYLLKSQNLSEALETRNLAETPKAVPSDISLIDFYDMLKQDVEIDKDYSITLTPSDIIPSYEELHNAVNGNGHTFTFTFMPNQNIALQLFKLTENAKISNVRFVFDLSNSMLLNSGIFGDIKNSIFYNVHIRIKNNNGMEITFSDAETVNGLFAKTIESSSLVHVGVFIEEKLSILFIVPISFSKDSYFGFIAGSFVDDSELVGAGGLFVESSYIICNITNIIYPDAAVYFGGLIGQSSIQLSDSVGLYGNVKIEEVNFGGLIGECISCQISTSFVEMNDIELKGKTFVVGGLVSKTKDTDLYSFFYYSYFKLNGDFILDSGNYVDFGGISGYADKCKLNTVVVEIKSTLLKTNIFTVGYLFAKQHEQVISTNSLVIGSVDVYLIANGNGLYYDTYTIGFQDFFATKLDESANVSYYLNNITYPFTGIEGFTERSEILLTKNDDNIYSISYLDNSWDFYYSVPANLTNQFDISTITTSTNKYTMKILPKRTTKSMIIYMNDNEIFNTNDIFDVSTSRDAIITIPTTITSPEGYITIHNQTFELYTAMYYDPSKIDDLFINKTIYGVDIDYSNPISVSILKNNIMRGSITCKNNQVKYTGDNTFEGSGPFEFTFQYDPDYPEEYSAYEKCTFKFIGTSLDSVDVEILFYIKNKTPDPAGIMIYEDYPNPRTRPEIDLTVFITSTPSSTVYFEYKCPSDLICNTTSFSIDNPDEFIVIHISQINPSNSLIFAELSFNITSTDLLYQALPPYSYTVVLNAEPEYLAYPPSFEWRSEDVVESSYTISTTLYPTSNVKITVDFSNCSNYYIVNPTSYTLSSSNDFIGKFIITPNISSLTKNFKCIISHKLETLDPDYSHISDKLNVAIYTYVNDLTPPPILLYVNESDDENTMVLHFDRDCYADEGIIKLYENDTDCNGKFIIGIDPPISYDTCIWMDRKTLKIYYEGIEDLLTAPPPVTVHLANYVLRSTESSSEYSTGSSVVTLRAANPEMIYAQFDDGYTITIKFDNDIGYGITDGELCSNIFSTTESLGSSICSFGIDKKTVVIDLSADAEIIPGNTIEPLPNKIKGSINSKKYSQNRVTVLPPSPLPEVKAAADYQAIVTSCQTLIIDGSLSSGGSSRSLIYKWENKTVVNEKVYEYINTDSSILKIPSDILNEDVIITLKLTVSNFFGNSDTTEMNIQYVTTSILQSSIEGSPTLTLKTDKEIYIKGHGNLVECGESIEVFNISSKFSLYRIDDSASQIEIELNNFTTKDPTRLYFAPHSLPVGIYKIKYNISMEGFSDSISELMLNVVLGDFYFTVKGYPVMSLANTEKLTLAVEAKDLDFPDTEFDYKWNCSSDDILNENTCRSSVNNIDQSTISFDENKFTPGVYNFTSTAYPDDDSNRTMSVYILVTFTDGTMKLSFSIESLFSNSTVYKPSDVIGLKVKFDDNNNDNNNSLRYLWVYMSDSSLNPLLSRNDSLLVYVSCEKMNTKLISHTIRFYVYKGNQNLYSDYVFNVIEPPKGGFIVSSSDEVYLGDSIVISSSNWEGAKDFTYRFGVLVNGNLYYLQPIYSNSNKYNGMLPLGDKQKDYNLTLIVFVKDKYGAISNTTNGKDGKPLIIKCYPINSIEIIKNITKKLEEENNYDQIFNFANGVKNQITTDLANTTNCVNGSKSSNNSCNCFEGYTGILCDLHIPIDGGLSVNYTYSEPDRECGKITQYRWKTCDNPKPQYGGKECEIIKEKIIKVEPCEDSDKNVDGGWNTWSEWSECNAKCEIYNGNEVEGITSRNRLCNNPLPYNEGKECEGNSTESVKCYKSCSAPNKLCPGEYINSNGKAAGSKCNERGKCIINREGCKEYEPNCHSSCECKSGYSGSSCQYTDEEFLNNKEIKNSLISSIDKAIQNSLITPESIEQQSSTILNVIDPPIDLNEDSLELTFTIIDNTIAILKDDKPAKISSYSINDYVKATSLLIQNEWDITAKEANKRNLENINEIEYSIGSQLINLYENISEVHYNQQYSAPLLISTDSLGISLIKADLSFDPNATISTNQAEVDLGNIIDVDRTTEIAIFDFIDNPNKNDYIRTNRTSGLTSITLSNENGDMDVKVNDLTKPIYYRQRLNDDTELRNIRCSFYNGDDLKFIGVVLVGIIKVENGSKYAVCAMLHLTDFTVQKKSIFPKMNFVNPIGDAKLLGNYDSSNMLVPIILGSVLVLCIVFWIYTKCKDKDEDRIVSEEKARNFLLYGKFRPSKKEEKKVKEKTNENENENEKSENKEKENDKEKEKSDNDDSIKIHFFKYYSQRLLDEHKILAPAFQSINELMEVSRSQNVLCLTAIILTDTAVNALFFGLNPANIAQVVTTSIISTLVMLPATMIIPFLFKFANTYKSHTLQSKSKNKKSKLTVLKSKIELIKKQIMNENSTLFKYHTFMLIESSIFIILELIFTIIALIVLPSGYITIIIVGLFVLYIIETFLIFVITTLKRLFYYLYMLVIVLFMLFNFAILVLYFIILSRNEKIVYNTWKLFYDISSTQELYCLYIEESLNCCGWNNINDYNVSDCTTVNAYVSGNQNSCKDIYYDKFDQYSPFWIIYFLIGIISFIPTLVVLVKYLLYKFDKVMPEDQHHIELYIVKEKNVNEEEEIKRKSSAEIIIRCCRKLLFKRHFIREREYIIWLRNRKIRTTLLSFANFIVCLYIIIMVYINLLYGVKFESSQATKWIISSVISMILDLILQEPSMILLKTVASTTLTSLI